MKTLTITERRKIPLKIATLQPGTALVPVPSDRRLKHLPSDLTRIFRQTPRATEPLGPLPPKRTYTSSRAQGWISRLGGHHLTLGKPIEIELPPGTPRYVNASTLKRLLGGRNEDRLLMRAGAAWKICDNAQAVDLQDTATEYRVGPVAVYS